MDPGSWNHQALAHFCAFECTVPSAWNIVALLFLGSLLRLLFSAYVSLSCPVLPPQGEVSLLWNSIAPWSSLTTPCEGLLNHAPCYPLSSVRLGPVPLTYVTPST